MEFGAEAQQNVNMNVFVNNYININLSGPDAKSFNFKNFAQPQQKAKSHPKVKPTESYLALEASTRSESQEASPKQALRLPETLSTEPEAQIQPKITQKIQSDLYESRETHFEDKGVTQLIGVCLIVFAALLFTGFFFSILPASWLGTTQHTLLDFIQHDSFYPCLIPMMIPVSFVFLYLYWVSIKVFRHA